MKHLPILELPQWLWLWAGVIVAIKVVNQHSALVMYGRCCFPHTLANKVTGFLLFITVPMTFWSIIPITIVASVATYAAIHEGCVLARAESSHACILPSVRRLDLKSRLRFGESRIAPHCHTFYLKLNFGGFPRKKTAKYFVGLR